MAREAEKEEKKNSSHAAHRQQQAGQGQNEALVRGFPGNAAAKLEDGRKESPTADASQRASPIIVPMPPPAFGDNDEDLGIRDIDAELEAAIEESRRSNRPLPPELMGTLSTREGDTRGTFALRGGYPSVPSKGTIYKGRTHRRGGKLVVKKRKGGCVNFVL